MPAIVDSSAVIAAFDAPSEISFLLGRRHCAAAAAEATQRLAGGPWPVEAGEHADLVRAARLRGTYADADLGFVDAMVVAIAERLGATRIHTLDRRHFSLVRPRHVEGFEILPEGHEQKPTFGSAPDLETLRRSEWDRDRT